MTATTYLTTDSYPAQPQCLEPSVFGQEQSILPVTQETPALHRLTDANDQCTRLVVRWQILPTPTDSIDTLPLFTGIYPLAPIQRRIEALLKLESLHHNRIAGALIDPSAQLALSMLGQRTSLRWETLDHETSLQWPEACRGIALLAAAGLCEVGPIRARLTEEADRMLSAPHEQHQTLG